MKGDDLRKRLIKGRKKLHLALLDPKNCEEEEIRKIAPLLKKVDGIMVGGSTVESREEMDETIKTIKDNAKGVPVIIFPNSAESVSKYADYIFFMMLLNSMKRRFLVGEQLKGTPWVAKYKLKTISMGYILISCSKEPTTVEMIVKPDKIDKENIGKAVNYARIAQYFGMDCIYLEAGSGADEPVSIEMIEAVGEAVKIPIIVGGAIRDSKTAKKILKTRRVKAIVTGTIFEENIRKSRGIVSATKKFRRKKS